MKWIVEKAENWFCIPLLVIILVTMLLQVFSRQVVGRPIRWTAELSNLSLVWLTFIGAAICHKNKEMVKLDVFLLMLPDKWQSFLDIIENIIFIILSIIFSYYGILLAISEAGRSLHTIPISRAIRFISIPAGFILFIFVSINTIRGNKPITK